MSSNGATQSSWPNGLPSCPDLPSDAASSLRKKHTALCTKIEDDFQKALDSAQDESSISAQSRLLSSIGSSFKSIEGNSPAAEAYVAQWRAIVQQAKVMLNIKMLGSSLSSSDECAQNSTPIVFVGNYNETHKIISSTFSKYYSPWTKQMRLSSGAANDLEAKVMKAVLDAEPTTEGAKAAKQTLLSADGVLGPKASDSALTVRSALLNESQADSSSSSPFEKMFMAVHAGKHSWIGVEWKELRKIQTAIQGAKYPSLNKEIKFDDDSSIHVKGSKAHAHGP